MKLKRLELLGFKSFCEKTVIRFDGSITCVVGPNGCGKSNIVDAIKWVLGEMSSKELRGEYMGDVIFNGSDRRPPLGMAEVTLVFDNEEQRGPAFLAGQPEIAICRRVFRSGESEYYINKTACRLKDIVDIFLGTGLGGDAYSIVEQGKVGAIVSAKPEERRSMIEEAAGITRYKVRKREALRKMEQTEQNLARVGDIVGEVTRQIQSLERQARKAKRFKEAKDRLRRLELHLGRLDRQAFARQETELAEAVAEKERQREAAETRRAHHHSLLESGRLELAQREEENNRLRDAALELDKGLHALLERMNYAQRQGEELAARLAALTAERAEVERGREEAEGALARCQEAFSALEAAVSGAGEELRRLEESYRSLKRGLDEGEGHLDQLKRQGLARQSALAEKRSLLSQAERELARLAQHQARLQEEHQSLRRALTENQARQTADREQAATLKQEQQQTAFDFQRATSDNAALQEAMQQVEEHYFRLNSELSAARSKLQSLRQMQQSYEGVDEGIRAVMTGEGRPDSLVGVLADFIRVPAELEKAIGAALESRLQAVVFTDYPSVLSQIERLKGSGRGRGRFLPLSPKAALETETESPGLGLERLAEKIEIDPNARELVERLLRNVYLAADLDQAYRAFAANGHQAVLVTVAGEVFYPDGSVAGGAMAAVETGRLTRNRQIEQLCDEVSRLEAALAEKERNREELGQRIAAKKEEVEVIRSHNLGKELAILEQEKHLSFLRQEGERLSAQAAVVEQELAADAAEAQREEGLRQQLQGEVAAQEAALTHALSEVAAAEAELAGRRQGLEESRAALMQRSVELAGAQEKRESFLREKRNLEQRLADCRRQAEEKRREEEEKQLLRLEKEALQQRCSQERLELEAQRAVTAQRLEELRQAMETLRQSIELAERESESEGQRTLTLQGESGALQLRLAELQMQLRNLAERIFEKYAVDLGAPADEAEAAGEADRERPLEELRSESEALREKVAAFGEVNLASIEELAELEQRQQFLEGQKKDLEESLENLRRTIRKINTTTREKFIQTFEAVNERFEKIFPLLFRGGRAKLVLQNPEDLLQTGVDVFAQPPGKKLQNMNLLSGGEKALTAISLLFAIFLYNPAPFCLLDEVDAPLDDVNIERFNNLVKDLSRHSQFVIITHNKGTMAIGDLLYGITMQEPGVSKVVSVRLAQDEEGDQAGSGARAVA